MINLSKNFHEKVSAPTKRILEKYDTEDHKTAVWNAFVDSDLTGVNDDDFSILPRLLPESYLPVVEETAREMTTFVLKLLSLPEAEVRAILPKGPVRDYLIDGLEVLKHRPNRFIGSFRFDFAVVGKPDKLHPPQLLEINEIGFDGLGRSNFFQDTLLSLMPELKKRVRALDTCAAETRNMARLGNDIARIQYDCYNWDEEILMREAAKQKVNLHLVSPSQYKSKIHKKDFPLLKQVPFNFTEQGVLIGDDLKPDGLNLSFAFTLSDLKRDEALYRDIIRSKTPMYGHLTTGLVASKAILMLFADEALRRRLLGSSESLKQSILPAFSLAGNREHVIHHYHDLVIKHTDGFGGQQVFMDSELMKRLKRIPKAKEHEWVMQKKTRLNSVHTNGILSRRKEAIADLGVFVHYDWQDGKLKHFEVGGLMTRANNKSLKVNISSGGLQSAVMLELGR